ncbi:MAG TPA: nucleotidyltransferase domain-containing protein [Thermodesulfovibrionia bacterium]|nr:nucleotidyltransferase domain-containing protein [Thermodesulfovibrionia bacterium]
MREILSQHVPECEVIAFGSRVTGTAKEYSDLDLAIITDKLLPVRTMAKLKEAFSESRLPFKVDVVDWGSASDGFRNVIKEKCKIVQRGGFLEMVK